MLLYCLITGRFSSEELSTEYNLVVVGGKLIAKHSRVSDIELLPAKKDVFSSGLGQIEFTRNSENVINGFKVDSGRVRNLWLKKMN